LTANLPPETHAAQADWHRLSVEETVQTLAVVPARGLDSAEAARRLEAYGPNELRERGAKPPWRIFVDQFTGTLVLILIVAAVISAIIADWKDAIAILAIVFLNAVLGFVQEYRAEQAMAALKKLAAPSVRVRRDGALQEIAATQLVPGDIILLEAGNLAPADGRLLEAANLRIQEAILTGESEAVEKITEPIAGEDLALGDQRNMGFLGTTVVYGRGQLAVTATGMQTQLGRVADMIQSVEEGATPLQRRLDQLGRGLAVAALVLVVIIFVMGWLTGESLDLMVMTAISMAVAVVPEGLPAVVTISLALGAQRMLKRQALIRKLPAVETLGSVTVICSDKTGTLTENRMTVTVLDLAGHRLELTEQFHQREPVLLPAEGGAPLGPGQPGIALLLAGGALCSDAVLRPHPAREGEYHAVGDPTEGALVVAAARFGLWEAQLDAAYSRVGEIPFDSDRKRMTTVHCITCGEPPMADQATAYALAPLHEHGYVAFTKGAGDGLLDISDRVWVNDHAEPIDDHWRARVAAGMEQMAEKGMRVLGLAFRPLDAQPTREQMTPDWLERNMILLGLVGMIDPPRAEVRDAVALCKTAGIRPVMITGDHPLTARQIASELGISENGRVLTGQELARLTPEELAAVVEDVSVYARVSPEHKLNIVQALQSRGHIVSMTGDGVNDAPALRRADIGVAMGITGTDVSKEAAEMVLLDDNFSTIVAAVEEGRAIYDNIRKFIKFSLAGNLGKVITVLVAPLLGLPLPLTPFQILWMNLATDGLLGLGMSVEAPERDTMQRPPYDPNQSIFGRGLGAYILFLGVLIGAIALGMALWAYRSGQAEWQTMVLTTLIFSQAFQALATRSNVDSLFGPGFFRNRPLWIAIIATVALQLLVIYAPFLHTLFGTMPLSAAQLAAVVGASSLVLWVVELEKWFRRRRAR
jgi:Ca2+-transporting ATPase